MAFRLIEAVGLDRDKDFRARERLSPAESTNAIKDGKLDAYFFVSGVPTSAVTDLAASPGVKHPPDRPRRATCRRSWRSTAPSTSPR